MVQFPESPFDALDHPHLIELSRRKTPDADSAKVALIKAHRPLLISHTRNVPPALREDGESAAISGFLDALSRFDSTRGISLGHYASKFVKGAVSRLIRGEIAYQTKKAQLPDHLYNDTSVETLWPVPTPLVTEEHGFEDVLHNDVLEQVKPVLDEWVAGLSPKHRSLLNKHFALGISQSEIARAAGVTRAAISKQISTVLAKGRKEVKISGLLPN